MSFRFMSNLHKDQLFSLVKSLTKSEKRNFKIFANRTPQESKFLFLFDALDKISKYDEDKILKHPAIKKSQLSNLKAVLYKQILSSLRLQHASKDIDLQFREQMDCVKLLYNKGLYVQSLKLLAKLRVKAKEACRNILLYEILEFEKHIELQFITRSISNKAEVLTNESAQLAEQLHYNNKFSNLAIQLYDWYLKLGHVRNERDFQRIERFFKSNMQQVRSDGLCFFDSVYVYQSHVWYSFITQNFLNTYKYSCKWLELFEVSPKMKALQPEMYIKALGSLLEALFMLLQKQRFELALRKLESLWDDKEMVTNDNIDNMLFHYSFRHRINLFFISGEFPEGVEYVEANKQKLIEYRPKLDVHRLMTFDYKIACVYFGAAEYKKVIKYLNEVIKSKDVNLRSDLHCFARILNLIAHYELGNDSLVDYLVVP